MSKLILFTAVSLDGFIAGPQGEIDWLFADADYGYTEFYASIGSLLMGYKTFETVKNFEGPYPHSDRENVVFSRSAHAPFENVLFVNQDPVEFTTTLKSKMIEDIWLVGGGQLNGLMLQHELIDEIVLSIHPVTLGYGIPFFSNFPYKISSFDLHEARPFPSGMLQVTYRKKA